MHLLWEDTLLRLSSNNLEGNRGSDKASGAQEVGDIMSHPVKISQQCEGNSFSREGLCPCLSGRDSNLLSAITVGYACIRACLLPVFYYMGMTESRPMYFRFFLLLVIMRECI